MDADDVCACRAVEVVERAPGEWVLRPLDELCPACRRRLALGGSPDDAGSTSDSGPVGIDVEYHAADGGRPSWTARGRDDDRAPITVTIGRVRPPRPATQRLRGPAGSSGRGADVTQLVLERTREATAEGAMSALAPEVFDRLCREWSRDDCTGLAALADLLDRVHAFVRDAVASGATVVLRLIGVPARLAGLLGDLIGGLVVRHFLTPLRSLARLLRVAGILLCALADDPGPGECACRRRVDAEQLRGFPTPELAIASPAPALDESARVPAAEPAQPHQPAIEVVDVVPVLEDQPVVAGPAARQPVAPVETVAAELVDDEPVLEQHDDDEWREIVEPVSVEGEVDGDVVEEVAPAEAAARPEWLVPEPAAAAVETLDEPAPSLARVPGYLFQPPAHPEPPVPRSAPWFPQPDAAAVEAEAHDEEAPEPEIAGEEPSEQPQAVEAPKRKRRPRKAVAAWPGTERAKPAERREQSRPWWELLRRRKQTEPAPETPWWEVGTEKAAAQESTPQRSEERRMPH